MTRCKFAAKSKLPIEFGDFEICAFEEDSGKEHIALVLGKIENQENVLCRVHSECLTGDTCLLYTSPSPRDLTTSRMPSSA